MPDPRAAPVPADMTAVEITRPGPPEVLVAARRPTPTPGANEVLIRVAAAGVNRPDVLQRRGGYPPPPGASDLPGLEIAGEIAALGPDATGWRLGDRVCALVTGGGYAEYCAAPAPQCLPVPAGLDMIAAAALPETFFTVWSNLYRRARLGDGESLLVHGGSSGIGTAAIQIAATRGSRVFATAGSAEKCAACARLGAERAVNYRDRDYVAEIKEATEGRGVDVVLDMVGGDYIRRNIAALAPEGRLVQIAFLAGSTAEIDLLPVMLKRLTITGSTLRPRSVEEKAAIARDLRDAVWPHLESGRIAPVIDSTFALADAARAHARMEGGAHIGKIVLTA